MSQLHLQGLHPLLFFIFLLFILPHALLRPLHELGVSVELDLLHVELLPGLRYQSEGHSARFHQICSAFFPVCTVICYIRRLGYGLPVLLCQAELWHLPPYLGHRYHYLTGTSVAQDVAARLCLSGALLHHRCELLVKIFHFFAVQLIYDLPALLHDLLLLKDSELPVLLDWLPF